MRTLFAALALAAFLVPGVASADDVADRSRAIALCRADIAAQAGVDAESVRLDQVTTRARQVRVDLDLWRDGQLTNVRCVVDRSGELRVASINPSVQTASTSAPAASQ